MDYIAQLKTEFSTLQGAYSNLLKEQEKREYTAEEKTAQETRFARMSKIKSEIDERLNFAKLALDPSDVNHKNLILPTDPEGKQEFQASKADIMVQDRKIDRAEYNKAMVNWAVTGEVSRQFATITTGTTAIIPKEVLAPQVLTQVNAFREALALVGLAAISTPTTAQMSLPVIDIADGSELSETANSSNENEPTFDGSILHVPTAKQSGTSWISGLAEQANGYDIVGYFETVLNMAKELKLESDIVADLVNDGRITRSVNVGGSDPTYQELVKFNRLLPKKYDRLKVMVLDGTFIEELEGLTDTTGKPILNLDPQNVGVYKFNGTPVVRSDYFADWTGSEASVVGVVISMLGFQLRDAGAQKVLRYQESGKPDQTGLNLVSYHSYGWSPNAVGFIKK